MIDDKKKKIESKTQLGEEDKECLEVIEEELIQCKEYEKYLELSEKDIKKRLEQNSEESFEVFAGEDIYIIAEFYGITRDDIEKIIIKKVVSQQRKIDISSEESSKAKKLKGKIISQIKELNNPELNKLISKVAKEEITQEEMKLLQDAGIETEEYESICINKEVAVDVERIKADKIKGQVRNMLADKSVVESIVTDKIFNNVTEEEINAQILDDLIKTVKSHIYDYYFSQDSDGIITEWKKEQINEKIIH